jgi:hypothetical protein
MANIHRNDGVSRAAASLAKLLFSDETGNDSSQVRHGDPVVTIGNVKIFKTASGTLEFQDGRKKAQPVPADGIIDLKDLQIEIRGKDISVTGTRSFSLIISNDGYSVGFNNPPQGATTVRANNGGISIGGNSAGGRARVSASNGGISIGGSVSGMTIVAAGRGGKLDRLKAPSRKKK